MTIRILSPQVQQCIAAGEVVARPASVLKELMENALDGGAETVRVKVQEGGRRLIQVIDDGSGLAATEVPLAFERFATSKIVQMEDLAAVRSFGFRGEALGSIASVSRLRLLSREKGTLLGTEARLEGGRMLSLQEMGASVGTRVEVWDLFYNTPARQKFLRSLRTEYGHILNTFTRFALAFPEKHFTLTMDGRELHVLPPATRVDRITALLGQQAAAHLEEFHATGSWGRLGGFVIPTEARGRSPLYLFVNRRPVRNVALYRAIRDGLQEAGSTVLLFLDIHPSQVDVNVHPAKAEVRFRDEQALYEQVRSALKQRTLPWQTQNERVAEEESTYGATQGFRLLGQVENTFLVTLSEGQIYLLDQHAAEERVLYERLQQGKVQPRELVAPQVVTLSPEERAFVETHREALESCGFVVEPLGPQALALRAIPDFLSPPQSGLIFSRLLPRVRSQREDFQQALSCLGAIKAGESLAPEAQERLLNAWVQTDHPHACAHNRPVYFRLSLDEVRRKVGRTGLSCEFDTPSGK
ncbi:DNA mismatch repair protein MutL [Nitrosococcus halophilus Nc 4]|uniref:DNA mismatch repair protein MutL n=1 Tax=Nitrosococcus halophilus (strain Nc4) TaxID=472759 RepID=D5C3L5_NITHN|nr:DNA mismatch repair endonuclease MutL [Nitrosococcus halophilus]ADE14987.1 DNA mismatch repair protein MutL [Nitrosococcus halophilus Nc 4]